MIVFDYNNSGNIHEYLGNKVIKLPKEEFTLNYDCIYFADNNNISINKVIEKNYINLRKKINKDYLVINSTVLYKWSQDRLYSYKIMEKIFKNNKHVKILEYGNIENWNKEKGVIKLRYEDAGYKSTYIFKSKEELNSILETYQKEYEKGIIIQEYCEGEEIAFGSFFINSEPVLPVYISFEFKRSISNQLGGNTGQSAEFGFYSTHEIPLSILQSISEYLKRNKINYTGTIDINGGWLDNTFYPYEFTVCRDGYPQILALLHNENLYDILKTKQWKNTKKKYIIIIRIDNIEDNKKTYKFKVNEEEIRKDGYIWIPECKKKEDYYITDDANIIGLIYKESDEIEKIEIKDTWFNIPIIYYISFNEDVQKKWEDFKWLET